MELILTDKFICILFGKVYGLLLLLAQVTLITTLILHLHLPLWRRLHPDLGSYVLERGLIRVHQVDVKNEELHDEDHDGQVCDQQEPGQAREGTSWRLCGRVEGAQVRYVKREVAEVGRQRQDTGCEVDGGDQDGEEKEHDEVLIVGTTDTIVEPLAVVVEGVDAAVTLGAVLGALQAMGLA